MIDYTKLIDHASEKQQEYIKAINDCGSQAKAAKALGVNKRTIERSLKRLREKAAEEGVAPELGVQLPPPSGYYVSTYRVDAKQQYIPAYAKKDPNTDYLSLAEDLEDRINNYKKAKKTKFSKKVSDDYLNLVTLSDSHLGQLSWKRETGENWNMDKAVDTIYRTFEMSMNDLPKAGTCFINQLGDFLHYNSHLPITPTAGHMLDTDSRYYKVVEEAVVLLRRIVDLALDNHKKVILLCAEGNHDLDAPPWLHMTFKSIYEKEPRLEVIDGPRPYYAYEFGDNLLAFHHGHKKSQPGAIREFFSNDREFRPMWGRARRAYCHTGHLHHEKQDGQGFMKVVQHPTMASKSSYEARAGWESERGCLSFSYHKVHGQRTSSLVVPEMLGDMDD